MGIAVGLMSGGLDSWLACILIKKLGFDVHALHFCSPFFGKKGEELTKLKLQAEKFGINIIPIHVKDDYIDVLINPKHGYGSCANPCIDCHIYMFKTAKEYMLKVGGQFVFTGEVLNQRPMSQRKPTLINIEKESGLDGMLLRPLSAQYLEETIPEKEGIVPREKLLKIQGRNRKAQFELAKQFGLTEYPGPAGGCILTDPNYITKIDSLKTLQERPTWEDLELLRIGRHFNLGNNWRMITSRDTKDGDKLFSYSKDRMALTFDDAKGSYSTIITPKGLNKDAVLQLNQNSEVISIAASIASRYSKAYNLGQKNIPVLFSYNEKLLYKILSEPFSDDQISKYKI